ncbi:Protein of unknown function [Allochromatium warmingii]|uniref:Lcl C-terminal domain-containing protein n=1 Tax=Allochromatium warmingii TaxID=61595 RepID=A0A1H3G6R8_ALLWA|nr:DUF1566 domain-containing protein [Allochromatium warmingii]SDX98740.1 Protein of unknown function [Allochromatium warmingii]
MMRRNCLIDRAHLVCLLLMLGIAPILQAQNATPAPQPDPNAIPAATDTCLNGTSETTPSSDFTLLAEGAVVRHETTQLEWQRCPLGLRWDAAVKGCLGRPLNRDWERALKAASKAQDGWRMPNAEELLTIVEKCRTGPTVNIQVFPNTPTSNFWSTSLDSSGSNRVWAVSFFSGRAFRTSKIQGGSVRLVRGTLNRQPPADGVAPGAPR